MTAYLIHTIRFFKRHASSALFSALLFFAGFTLVSCSPAAKSLFFDIPERPPEPEPVPESATTVQAEQARQQAIEDLSRLVHPADSKENRPPIEDASTWEEALALLPKDATGQPDWDTAVRDGVVMPRALDPADRDAGAFKLDFYLKGANPMFDAYFPHSSHLEWMGCDSCHPAVFKYRDNDMSMAAINQGEYCGACHGKIAFPVTACKRCHTGM